MGGRKKQEHWEFKAICHRIPTLVYARACLKKSGEQESESQFSQGYIARDFVSKNKQEKKKDEEDRGLEMWLDSEKPVPFDPWHLCWSAHDYLYLQLLGIQCL